MDKETAKKEIEKLVKEFLEYSKEEINSKSENQIKSEFIDPLFGALGWDMRKDAERETRILKGRADYILKIGNEEVLVVEAKKAGVNLSEDEGRQAVSYAYHRKIKFAVVTNFKEIKVYHALSNIKQIDHNLLKFEHGGFFRLSSEQFIENIDKLMLLSKESFEKREINKLLSKKDEKLNKPIDVHILNDLLKIREWLSKDLKDKRTYLSEPQIDEIVQRLIDRLIFIRSVEDRGLEPMNYLKSLEADVRQQQVKLQLFPYLLEKFKDFNTKYDSKLFELGILEKEGVFSDEVLRKVILALYFGVEGNQERYLFDQIPVDLFGSIYEQYLGTILQGTEKRVKLDESSGKRKKMGIYYTPSYIVDYIVKNTVGEYIKNKTIDEILEVKIVDPACGSGSFIVRAFQEVCNVIEEKLKAGEKSTKFKNTFNEWKGKLNFGEKIVILKNCIYGVDLDEKAVELAHLNLILATLEGENSSLINRRLPEMNKNLKNGNSLIDDPKVAGDKAFNWHAQFPDIFRNGGFDVVIGNPPYVNIFNITDPDRTYFQNNYETATNKSDLYSFFIENSVKKLIKNEGQLGVIVSNTWISIQSFEKLRYLLLNKMVIQKIVPLENGVFAEAVVVPIIIIAKKEEPNKLNNIELMNFNDGKFNLIRKIPQAVFRDSKNNVISISYDDKADSIFKKMKNNIIELGKIGEFSLGVKTADNDKFISLNKIDGLSKKVIKGKYIERYFFSWNNEWLWYNPKEMMKRKGAGPRKQEFFETEKKIILQEISGDKIIATLDTEKFFAVDTVNILYKLDDNYNFEFILGLLNSKLINFWYGSQFKGIHVKLNELRIIPIKIMPLKSQKIIVGLVDQMLSLQKKLHESKLAGNEKERLEQQINNTDYEIDQEVYKLYGLTKDEIKIVEESLK